MFKELKHKVFNNRFPQKCAWCGDKVEKELIIYRTYLIDNKFHYDRIHFECEMAFSELMEIGENPEEFFLKNKFNYRRGTKKLR